MARRKPKKARIEAAYLGDPEGLGAWLLRFLEANEVRGYSLRTLENQRAFVGNFIAWCQSRDLTKPTEITRPILQAFQRYLFYYRQKSGKPLSTETQIGRLSAIRMYFKWLTRENVIPSNPASELDLPKRGKHIPKQVLTAKEAEAVLAVPDVETTLGLRDRSLLETLYSTGMRRMEILGLKLFDVDWSRETIMIRSGKGDKDRVVPVGERALAWADLYLREARLELVSGADDGYFYLGSLGEPMEPRRLSQLVRRYIQRGDTGKSGSCHLFRHTAATTMLENGADIRVIQEFLGHANLATTQVYTRVSIHKLKEIHTATHPSARLKKTETAPHLMGLDLAEVLNLTLAEEAGEEAEEEAQEG